jgi:Mycothiol maleylpyruvate isomerase N-terminal domain
VARHVVGTMADVTAGRLDGLGTPEATKRAVDERAGRTPAELADECVEVRAAAAGLLPQIDDTAWVERAPGGYDGTLGDGIETLWYDTWLHADDIRTAVGQSSVIGPSLAGAVSHVGTALAKLDCSGDVPTDDAAALSFILTATGRAPSERGGPPNIYA